MKSLLSVLQSPFDSRTKPTLLYIGKFLQDVALINQFAEVHGEQFVQKLCSFLKGEVFKEFQVIITSGVVVENLYLLLEGVVARFEGKPPKGRKKSTIGKEKRTTQQYSLIEEKNAFAEAHFVSKSISTHYYVAEKDCLVAYININDFEKILRSKNYIEIMQEVGEFSQILFYQRFGISSLLEQIILKSSVKSFNYKEVVYEIGQPSDAWYIIKSGEFGIFQLIDKNQLQSQCIKQPEQKQGLKWLQDENFVLQEKIEQSYQPMEKLLYSMVRQSGQHVRDEVRFRLIRKLVYGDFFGQEEILENNSRKCRVVSLSNESKVRIIQSTQFQQFCRIYPQFSLQINDLESQKKVYHQKRKQLSEHVFTREWLADPYYFRDEKKNQISRKYQLKDISMKGNFVPLKRIKNSSCCPNSNQIEVERKQFLDCLLMQHRKKIADYFEPHRSSRKYEDDPRMRLFLEQLKNKSKSMQSVTNFSRGVMASDLIKATSSDSVKPTSSDLIKVTSNSLFRKKSPKTRRQSEARSDEVKFFFSHRQSKSVNQISNFIDVFQRVSDPNSKMEEQSAASTTNECLNNYIQSVHSRFKAQMGNVKNAKLMRNRYLL